MRQEARLGRLLSFVFIVILSSSMFMMVNNAAIPQVIDSASPVSQLMDSQYDSAQDPPYNNGTYTNWFQESDSVSEEWTQTQMNWLYGPSPSFEVFHENDTLLTGDHYAEIDEKLKFSVVVPQSILPRDAELGLVMFYGQGVSYEEGMFLFIMAYAPGESNLSIILNFPFPNWVNASSPWYGIGDEFDIDKAEETGSYKDAGMGTNFMNLYTDECTNTTDDFNFYYNFTASFGNDTLRALYQIGMMVYDTNWNQIATYNYNSMAEMQGLPIGIPPSEAWAYSYGGTYTLERFDLEGNEVFSVTREEDFIMRFNLTGAELDYVQLGFMVPEDLSSMINRTGWHWETVTEQGGWVYNDTLGTYVWNATVDVTYEAWLYGDYQEYDYADMSSYVEFDAYNLRWNETHEYYYVVFEPMHAERQFRFIYNASTDTFESLYGYEYYGYPLNHYVEGIWEEKIVVIEPIPADQPILYELNASLCTATPIGDDFIVEFGGHFTANMPVTTQYSWFYWEDRVIASDGDWFSPAAYQSTGQQSSADYNMVKRIVIESPVTIAKLLLENGDEPEGWLFQADPGVAYQVWGRLQGGAPMASDIEAVQFTLNAWDGRWTEEEDVWSQITYEITIDMAGTPHLRGFNHTQKHNWTYGVYKDWIYTNLTGWYYDYDSGTDTWDWVYGEYWDWQWMEVEDWHWEWWFFNQITQEWTHEWFGERSAESEIPADFCTTHDFSWWIEDGDLFACFLVNMTENIAETEYNWEFAFTANEWYMDYASTHGEHEMESWDSDWVYSFVDPSDSGNVIFMDPIKNNQLAFENDTLCANEGVDYLKGEERPYIIIDGDILPIKVRETYDPSSGETYTDFFYHDYWDPLSGQSYYYYELVNGTKISVGYTESIYIYNVTLNNGASFLTAQSYEYWWYLGGTYYHSWFDIDGNLYQGDSTLFEAASVVFHDLVELETPDDNYFILYGIGNQLDLAMDWRWDSITQSYYMTDIDGFLYRVVWNDVESYYEAYLDGFWQQVSYPIHYFVEEYDSSDARLVTWNTYRYWFHEKDGVEHEMPYPGANAQYWHHLGETDSQGGMVLSVKSFVYQGEAYAAHGESPYWSMIDGTNYTLYMYNLEYSQANDTEIWSPAIPYYTVAAGTFNDSLNFTLVEIIETKSWGAYWDGEREEDYIPLANGTIWLVNTSMKVHIIYEYEYDGKTFYSSQDYPRSYDLDEYTWIYYYEAINGTWVNMTSYEILSRQDSFKVEIYDNGTDDVFDFSLETYIFNYDGYWEHVYKVLNATYSGDTLYIPYSSEEFGFHDVYQFDYHGTLVNATASFDNIFRLRLIWGYEFIYGPQPIESVVQKNFYNLVIGTPTWGMWGVESWDVNPDNGALDLDGDLETVDDQYYILEVFTSTESWNHTWDMMWVDIFWDPNRTVWGDAMYLDSWMGLNTFTWSFDWERNYYWYRVDTLEVLSATELEDEVFSVVLTGDDDPRPGYWDVAWMAQNTTYAEYLAEAEENGWDWVESNEESWTWISFGISEDYGLSYGEPPVVHWLRVQMHYEFSGLLIWEDDNENDEMDVNPLSPGSGELSHYFMPDSVASMDFVTPGMAYGDSSASGYLRVNMDDPVTWGVTFYDVNGTAYPYNEYGYWGWYERIMYGSDLRSFDEKPTGVSIDEVSFLVHFEGNQNATVGALTNYVDIKVDNYVGNWNVDIIGGRDNLENRSLALNYLADVSMSDFSVKAGGILAKADKTTSSDDFSFETEGARFAELIMGGVTYDWSKNTTARYDVVSHTTPISTFMTAFESGHGKNAMAWNFTETMFYVTIGFPSWDGYSVFQDPVFVGYTSIGGTDPVTFGAIVLESGLPIEGEVTTIGVDISSLADIDSVSLLYSTDLITWESADMSQTTTGHWIGDIPSHLEGTTVYYKVVVQSAEGVVSESAVASYIVGSGDETTPTTPTSTTTVPPPEDLPLITIVIVLGMGLALVAVVLVFVRRR